MNRHSNPKSGLKKTSGAEELKPPLASADNRNVLLTLEQLSVITSDRNTNWIFLATILNSGFVEVTELSRQSDIGLRKCEAIALKLQTCGLVTKVGSRIKAKDHHVVFPEGLNNQVQDVSRAVSQDLKLRPHYWRTLFLRSTPEQMNEFEAKANELAVEFLNHENLAHEKNQTLYSLTIEVLQRDDLNLRPAARDHSKKL